MKPTFKVTKELLDEWYKQSTYDRSGDMTYVDYAQLAQLAANWGADQELDACYGIIQNQYEKWDDSDSFFTHMDGEDLMNIRRPKSKKLQVFEALERLYDGVDRKHNKMLILDIIGKIDEEYFGD